MARIEHFAIFADDLETLRAFYEDAFGLRVIVDNSQAPTPGYFLADESGTALEIIKRPVGAPKGDAKFTCHVAFHVDDFDDARDALDRRGVRFEADSAIDTESMRTLFFNDPAGNRCQLVWRPAPLGGG